MEERWGENKENLSFVTPVNRETESCFGFLKILDRRAPNMSTKTKKAILCCRNNNRTNLSVNFEKNKHSFTSVRSSTPREGNNNQRF